jgi:hypothetical protein
MIKKVFLLICLFLFCPCVAVSQEGAPSVEAFSSQDGEAEIMFSEALIAMFPEGEGARMNEARDMLSKIAQLYPHSRWRKPAESLVQAIDQEQFCATQRDKKQTRCDKCDLILQKKSQCKNELARVLVENDQLKKDLQRIKKLEIEMGQKNRLK